MISGMSTVVSYLVIPRPPPQPEPVMRNTVDWIGGTMITIGLLVLLFALSEGNVVGWSTPWVPALIVVSLLMVIAFGFWQVYLESRTQKRPLMKMSIFKNRKFTARKRAHDALLLRLQQLSHLRDILVPGLPRASPSSRQPCASSPQASRASSSP